MPIKAKFRESMRRLKASRFAIRIWFNQKWFGPEAQLTAFIDLVNQQSGNKTPEDIAQLAESFFGEQDNIAAIEVLSAATHNGVVTYYEWP
jgi:hypothetical protein